MKASELGLMALLRGRVPSSISRASILSSRLGCLFPRLDLS